MKLLEKHFDLAFTAPNGVQKLRELILTFAMQGKLVPQDPNDQPASEFLKAIEAEKQRLVKEGKIKQPKPLPEIKPEEIPYELPNGSEWVRLHNYGVWKSGSTPSRTDSSYYDGDIPWVKSGEVKQGRIIKTDETITQKALESCCLDLNPVGSVLVAMYGANIGDIGVLEIEATTNQAVCACKPYSGIDNIFLSYLLISLKQNFISQSAGAAQPNISREKIIHTVVPLPPLAEQRRIVAKIDQLMARCDELEKLRGDRNQKRITIHTAALNRLLTAKESSDFSTAWRFITQHFGELYSVKENVADLRKAILQLAVMGKLVPQDPKDEPASELLRAIELEKQQLVKEGKIKQHKSLAKIKPEEIPYQVPKEWKWVRLGNYCYIFSGNAFKSEDFSSISGAKTIKITNAGVGELIETNDFLPERFTSDYSNYQVRKNDLILALTRPYISSGLKISICPLSYDGALLNQRVAAVRPFKFFGFIFLFLSSPCVLNLYQAKFRDSGLQPNLKIGDVTDLTVPIPPLAEQHRIVSKVNQLMTLCNQLDHQIDAATSKQNTLLNAVMAQI